jgi:hypothetical protein
LIDRRQQRAGRRIGPGAGVESQRIERRIGFDIEKKSSYLSPEKFADKNKKPPPDAPGGGLSLKEA